MTKLLLMVTKRLLLIFYNFSILLFFTEKLLSFEISSYLKIVYPFIERDGSVIESDYEITILDAVEIVIAIFKKKIKHSKFTQDSVQSDANIKTKPRMK